VFVSRVGWGCALILPDDGENCFEKKRLLLLKSIELLFFIIVLITSFGFGVI
jgi:hypothetical protein